VERVERKEEMMKKKKSLNPFPSFSLSVFHTL
jgi:hypothetical protein